MEIIALHRIAADPADRRSRLATIANPAPQPEYRVTRNSRVVIEGRPWRVTLTYVPGSSILEEGAFAAYLGAVPAPTPEALAVTVLDDLNNELVPKWLRVTVYVSEHGSDVHDGHRVVIEDRQPGWENPGLLAAV